MSTRREFIRQAALLSGGLGALSAVPASVLRAASIEPAEGSTFEDAEHVVILMQENRSFDHAFGTLRGVRGFGDPRAITTPDGSPVWLQTNPRGETYAPFRMNLRDSNATWTSCLPHDRASQVAAGNGGKHDRWLAAKVSDIKAYATMPLTLGHYDRRDIPFYHAFADAFTVCDQHFSSVMSCTTPNRIFLWSGTNRDPRDPKAPPRNDNSRIDHRTHADWTTFPERLEENGVSWKVYQNETDIASGFRGEEDSWLGNYGDNPLEYFSQYHAEFRPPHIAYLKAEAGRLADDIRKAEKDSASAEKNRAKTEKSRKSLAKITAELERLTPENFARLPARERALHTKAFTTNEGDPNRRKLASLRYRDGGTGREMRVPAGDILHQFRKDADSGKLPAVSWLVAPENFSDHPSAPWYGAWYVSEALDILTKNPEVWKKTIFILTYDENDGYFDHVPPFAPPHTGRPETGAASAGLDTSLEFDERGHPIGLGFRVPMVIASPWTRGGAVCSEVFDHTSVLRFLEVFLKRKAGGPVRETNISAWRRTVCGDLTSAFAPHAVARGVNPEPVKRDPFVEGVHRAQFLNPPDGYKVFSPEEIAAARANPAKSSLLPKQEPGIRPSRALPYELSAEGRSDPAAKSFEIEFAAGDKVFGSRSAGAPFQVYSTNGYADAGGGAKPETCRVWRFAVASGTSVRYAWPVAGFTGSRYGLRTYGPNGFFREHAGNQADPALDITCARADRTGGLSLTLVNRNPAGVISFTLADNAYGAAPVTKTLAPGESATIEPDLSGSHRWYDLSVTVAGAPDFLRRYAGRMENGEPGMSDPALGRA